MSDQSKLGLGQIITTEQKRDAIHIAIAPVVADHVLKPGEHVGITKSGRASRTEKHIGVIDPFLKDIAETGATIWMFLYPGTITSLRHEWVHPAFGAEEVLTISRSAHLTKSEAWIADHAESIGLSYGALIRDAERWLNCHDHTVQRDSEEWRDGFHATEFWHHYEIVTKTVVPDDMKQSFYCCTC